MSRVTVLLPPPLREVAGGADELTAEAETVADLLTNIDASHPGLVARIMTPEGTIRPLVNVFIDNDDIRTLDGIDTCLADGAVVSIIPAIAGG